MLVAIRGAYGQCLEPSHARKIQSGRKRPEERSRAGGCGHSTSSLVGADSIVEHRAGVVLPGRARGWADEAGIAQVLGSASLESLGELGRGVTVLSGGGPWKIAVSESRFVDDQTDIRNRVQLNRVLHDRLSIHPGQSSTTSSIADLRARSTCSVSTRLQSPSKRRGREKALPPSVISYLS